MRLQRPPPPLPPPLSPPPRPPLPPKLCPARRRGWRRGTAGTRTAWAGKLARPVAARAGQQSQLWRGVGARCTREAAEGRGQPREGRPPLGGRGDAERRCGPPGGKGGSRAAPLYSASRSSRVCARLSVWLPGTDAAAGVGFRDGLGGRSCAASASPRSIFKAASGLGRPPALPSLPPARPPRLRAAAWRQPPGLRQRGGASGCTAPGGLNTPRPPRGLEGDLAGDPAAWPSPAPPVPRASC